MDLPIIDKIQDRARKAENRTREQLKDLHSRSLELIERGEKNLKQQADRSFRSMSKVEAQALDTVSLWLERAHQATGERAEWLDKGHSFLAQVARDIQLGNLTVDELPIEEYDTLGVKKVAHLLVDLNGPQREMIRSYEAAHKNRVSVYRAIDRLNRQEAMN